MISPIGYAHEMMFNRFGCRRTSAVRLRGTAAWLLTLYFAGGMPRVPDNLDRLVGPSFLKWSKRPFTGTQHVKGGLLPNEQLWVISLEAPLIAFFRYVLKQFGDVVCR